MRSPWSCARCGKSGYRGRTAIAELFLPDEECAQALRSRAPLSELERRAARAGFVPLIEDGRRKARAGVTTRSEVERVAQGQRFSEAERASL